MRPDKASWNLANTLPVLICTVVLHGNTVLLLLDTGTRVCVCVRLAKSALPLALCGDH